MTGGFFRSRWLLTVVLTAFVLICLLPVRVPAQQLSNVKRNVQSASAQRQFALTTIPISPPMNTVALDSSCPNQTGVLTSISVPVSYPLELAVISETGPAPAGGATFQLSSEDPSIVAAGDPKQSFLPEVTIPEGQTGKQSVLCIWH